LQDEVTTIVSHETLDLILTSPSDKTVLMPKKQVRHIERICKPISDRLPHQPPRAVGKLLRNDPAIMSIIRYLGEGGLGKVYAAKVLLDGKETEVAVKALSISEEKFNSLEDMTEEVSP